MGRGRGSVPILYRVRLLDRRDRVARGPVPGCPLGSADSDKVEIEGPAFTRFLLNNSRAGLFWLPIRVFVGFEFLAAGLTAQARRILVDRWRKRAPRLLAERREHPGRRESTTITFEWYRRLPLDILINNHARELVRLADRAR